MSRSNPTEIIPNPATRFFEWQGGKGTLRYYDKEKKENVEVTIPFDFILLDRLSTVKGWHDASESGIFANEVRDTRNETMLVRAFKMKEPIAEGFYSQIKDRVKAEGGKFVLNCYVAYTGDDGELQLGAIQFHGAALSAWMDFENDKENRPFVYKKGIQIAESKSGKKGGIKYEVPVFKFLDLPVEVNDKATEIDSQILQPYLQNYFKRSKHEQAVTDEREDRTDSPEYDQRRPDEDKEPLPF